jgi:hypothetical protein
MDWERANGGTDWNVWGPKPSNHIGADIAGEYGSEADARLIAAAPELLELAKKYRRECGNCGGGTLDPPCEDCADIRLVIAKATGEA